MPLNPEQIENRRRFMVDALTGELAFYIAEDENVDLVAALEKLYNSEFYGKLLNHDTLLYREGAGYLYEVYKENSS